MEEEKPKVCAKALAMNEGAKSKMPTAAILILVAIFLVFALLIGFLSRGPPPPDQVEYNGFIFTEMQGSWITQWQNNDKIYELSLRHNPTELEDVSIVGEINVSLFNQQENYVTFDPNKEQDLKFVALAAGEMGLNLKRALSREPIFTCTTNETEAESCFEVPPVTCDDADKPVFLIDATGEALVTMENNCVTITGKDEELLRATDRLLYLFYGIMSR